MTLRVPPVYPPRVLEYRTSGSITNSARIGTPPTGMGQWYEIGRAQNWLLGGGAMQLGYWGPVDILGGDTATFQTYAWPRPGCYARLWTFVLQGVDVRGAVATTDRPSGIAFSTGSTAEYQIKQFAELVTDTTPTGEAISLDMVIDSDTTICIVHSASCIELPIKRTTISGDVDSMGMHEGSLQKQHPIAEVDETTPSTTDQTSVAGVMRIAAEVRAGDVALRRAKLFDWSLEAGVSLSSSTFTNLFQIDPIVQARMLINGETSRTVRWSAYASASASAGEIRVTSSVTGATSTLTINSATPAWYSGSIVAAVDDFGESGWISGGSVETMTFERRATSGNIIVYGICVGERGV